MVHTDSESHTKVEHTNNPRDFRTAIKGLQTLNKEDMQQVNQVILEYMQSPVEMIPTMAKHLINAGGKRLRPLLSLSSACGLGYQGDKHVLLAAAVELIHGATLLHDDVVDESNLRRGMKTANVIWGNKESVLVGDFIFSRAFELMVKTGDIKVLDILSHASGVIAQGEVMQLETQKNINATVEMSLDVVKAKTAALFSAATQSGAVVATATPQQEQSLYDYGMNLGIAFQLVDDALDYSGTQEALGKSVGDDFREGKMTLPVIYAIKASQNAAETAFWQRTIAEGTQQEGDLTQAIEIMSRHQTIEQTLAFARQYADAAIDNLHHLPKNEHIDSLAELAYLSVSRAS